MQMKEREKKSMNEMMIYELDGFGAMRIIEESEKIWFGGTDAAKALGYANPWKAIQDNCRKDGVMKRKVAVIHPLTTSEGVSEKTKQIVEMTFITEGNLYRLITRSRLPSAEKFESLIFDEILPSIRRNGFYSTMTDEQLYELLGKRIKGNQEVVLREYERINPSTIKSVIPLSVMTERVVVKKTEPPVYPTI